MLFFQYSDHSHSSTDFVIDSSLMNDNLLAGMNEQYSWKSEWSISRWTEHTEYNINQPITGEAIHV